MPKPKPIQITIPNPCQQSWDEMTPQGDGRHCAHCQKVVIDFTSWSDTALYDFFTKNGETKLCGHFKSDQLNMPIIPHQPQSRLYRLFIGLGLTLILSQLPVSNTLAQTSVVETIITDAERQTTSGNDTIAIRGYVVDEKKEPVIGSIVQLFEAGKVIGGMGTDVDGFFQFNISADSVDLKKLIVKASYTSYKTATIKCDGIDLSKAINIQLELYAKDIEGLIIITNYKVPLIDKWESPSTTITSDQIEKMPR